MTGRPPLPENPLVSICVPTCNRAEYLRESLRTICAQTYAPLEIIISDNASTDGTEKICRELAENDSRVRYIRQPVNLGIYGNHNALIDTARGALVCLFHDDDLYEPEIVGEYVEFLRRHPDAGMVSSDWRLIDDAGETVGTRTFGRTRVIPGERYIEQTLRSGRTSVALPGAMVRAAALRDLRFDPSGPIGFGDFVVWMTIAETWDVGHIGRRLWCYRLHGGSLSRMSILGMTAQYRENLFRYCDARLRRHPGDAGRVRGFRRDVDRYLFWALLYEVARHVQPRRDTTALHAPRTIFDLGTYTLSERNFAATLATMGQYANGPLQRLALAAVSVSLAAGVMRPLTWAARYSAAMRALLRLR